MSRLFVDANILVEIMLGRSKMDDATTVFHDPEYEFFISSLTVHILYYFAEVEGIERNFVRKLADLAHQLPVSEKTITLAQQRYTGKDFEDCLQAACAELGGCREILTFDKAFHKNSATKLKTIII